MKLPFLFFFSFFCLGVLSQTQTCVPFNYTNPAGPSRTAVDIYDEFAIVGYSDLMANTGMIQIFQYNPDSFTWDIVFTANGANSGDSFGYSVAISNQYAFVGAPGFNQSTGAVYQYQFRSNSWSLANTFPGKVSGAEFGFSVALGDSIAVVGAPFQNTNNGAAYILKQSSGWAVDQTFTGTRGAAFGYSVAISNSNGYLAIGEPGVKPFTVTGKVYSFSSPSGNPYNPANVTSGTGFDFYGASVGVYGNGLSKYGIIVGIPLAQQIEIFNYDSSVSNSIVSQTISLSPSDFGTSVAIDRSFSGGKPLPVAGSPATSPTVSGFGYAFSSSNNGVGEWNFSTSISGSETFGYSIAVSAGTIICGDELSTITIWCSNVL